MLRMHAGLENVGFTIEMSFILYMIAEISISGLTTRIGGRHIGVQTSCLVERHSVMSITASLVISASR